MEKINVGKEVKYMKHIFIVGARGYHAKYGGWETFVSNLVENYNDDNVLFHISSLPDFCDKEYRVNNVIVTPFCHAKLGSAKMLVCTIEAFNYYLKYIKENNIKGAYIYVLGLKLGNVLSLRRNLIKKLGITIIVNPDGLEHERAKWNILVKKFFLYSEKVMLNNSNIIICDALGIKDYLSNKYPYLADRMKYIAYGTKAPSITESCEKNTLKEFNLKKDDYFLMVGRFVPENNYEMVIDAFMKCKTNKKLLIVSNISSSNYYNEVIKKTNLTSDERIVFIDGIYDPIKLTAIRKNAYLYIHGHSVGGTNPSLLESLSLTNLNILYDVCFNREVGRDACLYFDSSKSLTRLLDNISKYDRIKYGDKCKKIIHENYTWEIIVQKYKEIFK